MWSPTKGWAVGHDEAGGIILRWDGREWTKYPINTGVDLFSIDAVASNDAWAVDGWSRSMFHWDGVAWRLVVPSTDEWWSSVAMLSATDGWAAGITGLIVRWDGIAWRSVTSPTSKYLNAIAMTSYDDGWIVGGGYAENGIILHWNGMQWGEVPCPTAADLSDVTAVDSSSAWAVGESGTILRWDGHSWSIAQSPTSLYLDGIDMVSEDDGWAVGQGGIILRYYGTGAPAPTPTPRPGSIFGRITANGAAVPGISLSLWRYNDSSWSLVTTTMTTSQGEYLFTSVPDLQPGQYYCAMYGPNTSNPAYLYAWYGPLIDSCPPMATVAGGDFDIANVSLLSPPSGTSSAPPITFIWQKRGISTDTYRFVIFDPQTEDAWRTVDLGDTDRFTLTSLPSGAAYGKQYGWYVEVYQGDESMGVSHYYRSIYISAGAVTSPLDSVAMMKIDDQRGGTRGNELEEQ